MSEGGWDMILDGWGWVGLFSSKWNISLGVSECGWGVGHFENILGGWNWVGSDALFHNVHD